MLHHQRRSRPEKPIQAWKGPKPALAMDVTWTCRVHHEVLSAYLATVFKLKDYDVLLASGATPGMCPEYRVNGVLGSASNMKQQADNVRQGRRTRNLALILNVLCLDGFIPKGLYVIDTHPRATPMMEYTRLLNITRNPLAPPCVAFMKKHQRDKEFTELAKGMNQAMNTFNRKQADAKTQ